jgi:GNAT superfamily N-acetyltransferase
VVAASLPSKGYLARVLRERDAVIAYAFASRQDGHLLVERHGVRPENRRKGIGSRLMVSLIYAARETKLPVNHRFDDELDSNPVHVRHLP